VGEVDAAALRAHVGAGLARYKVPDRIAFLDAIPRNSMQKVIKRELRPLLVS
jgi:non-ribosomal peptide synthetase component E (peptide arylation enzyme)